MTRCVRAMLTIIAHGTKASLLAEAIKLINEEDAGRIVSRSLEHVSHTRRPDPHKHLHELSSCCSVEGNTSLACYSFRQQGLTCDQSQQACQNGAVVILPAKASTQTTKPAKGSTTQTKLATLLGQKRVPLLQVLALQVVHIRDPAAGLSRQRFC